MIRSVTRLRIPLEASIRCTERLAEADIETSVVSVGDTCENALAENITGLFKTEDITLKEALTVIHL
jgi:hypothetical protein